MKIRLTDGTGTIAFKYVYQDVDRHGNVRIYVKRGKKAPKIRLTAAMGSQEFLDQYRAALQGNAPAAAPAPKRPDDGIADAKSLRWLVSKYIVSAVFKQLDEDTRRRRRNALEEICDEVIDGVRTGPLPYALMETSHVREIRDQKASAPSAADHRLKCLRGLFRWACDNTVDLAKTDPTLALRYIRPKTNGWHTWTVSEILQYEARHPLGTKARLAFDILLYTNVRRSDVVRLGRQMEDGDVLTFTEYKGRNRNPKQRTIPLLPPLRTSIDACKLKHLTYLTTAAGSPHSAKGFTNWFKKRCVEAGLPHCSAHGVRKGGATIAAERGASTKQLQAIGGWTTLKEPERYTRAADLKRMARDAMHLVEPERKEPEKFPTAAEVSKSGKLSRPKPLKKAARGK